MFNPWIARPPTLYDCFRPLKASIQGRAQLRKFKPFDHPLTAYDILEGSKHPTMATRRTVPPKSPTSPTGDRILDPTYPTPSNPGQNSNIAPAVPASVVIKLLFFTFLMVVGPIGLYFLTSRTIFKGNATYSGITAAVAANVVLVGYIIAAVREDQGDEAEKERERQGKKKE
ncbi:MAG: vacuolar ATPase assembly integral membrane protein vma21 [Chrysothrix sp. TS-e1954]|nr:MAG: vacuolar ATPase assembly integral membrane protein vma21 [Chrysothrix sp. TS-e1954]